MPSIYNNDLTPQLWGSQGNVRPQSSSSTSTANVGGNVGQLQYNANGVLGGVAGTNYDGNILVLGNVANVNIGGGVPGQVLTKDANGNMEWANSALPNQPQIHFDVPVTGPSQSFAHPNLATFQDSTYAGVFRNGIMMPTDAYIINGQVLSINTLLLAGDRVDVLQTAPSTSGAVGNVGALNLNGNAQTFLDGTGNWQAVTASNANVGTIAALNLNGNVTNWLRGDGTWANIAVPSGNIGAVNLNGNLVQYLRGDGNWTNIAVPTGNIANTNYNGNAETYLNGQGSWVPVISGGIPGGANTQLQFNNNGILGGIPGATYDGVNFTLGSNTTVKLTGGNANSVLLTDGTGNLSWRSVVNYAAVPRMEFNVISAGAGQTFTNANLAVYPDSTYATVFRNGVLMDPTDYVISGTSITFPIRLEIGESIDVAASASVGTGSGTGGNGTVSNVATAGSGLGFALTGGPITSTGTITLTTPNAASLRTTLGIGNVANANFTGNGNVVLAGNGAWRTVNPVAGNTTEIQYNLNGVLSATNNMRYDTANNIVTFEGVTRLLDDVIVEGDLIPFTSNLYTLGNATHRWKDVFLSNNSVVIGDTTLSSNGGLEVNGEKSVTAPNDTITIGNVVANLFVGSGANLTNINSANIIGSVANADYATSAGSSLVANSVAISNVTGIGNIASINLNGNGSQVLAGNGAWITPASGGGNVSWANITDKIGANGPSVIALGEYAGVNQGTLTVAIGSMAGNASQGTRGVAIGQAAGSNTQGMYSVAIGASAGQQRQGNYSVAIGHGAGGINLGSNSIAIGMFAGRNNQRNNSIVLNATGANLEATFANSFTVKPMRTASQAFENFLSPLLYDLNSGEIYYSYVTDAPLTPTSPGKVGQVFYDSNYAYFCVTSNLWRRVALSASW